MKKEPSFISEQYIVLVNFPEGTIEINSDVFKNNVGEILEGPYDIIKEKFAKKGE